MQLTGDSERRAGIFIQWCSQWQEAHAPVNKPDETHWDTDKKIFIRIEARTSQEEAEENQGEWEGAQDGNKG